MPPTAQASLAIGKHTVLEGCATWEAAEAAAAEFLSPLLGSESIGTWDPGQRRWRTG